MYSTTSGHKGISSPPSEGKKIPHPAQCCLYEIKRKSTLSIPSKWMEVQDRFTVLLLYCNDRCFQVCTTSFLVCCYCVVYENEGSQSW